ncbi:MAG: hypothetical protein HY646_10985 [Acidobacteria bacterium]|nr:hypothetical protein [Acidobacteriota bacterium]
MINWWRSLQVRLAQFWGVQAQGRGSTAGFAANENVIFQGRPHASNVQLTFYPAEILRTIASSSWPDQIAYEEEQLPNPPPTKPYKLAGFGRVHALLMQAAFVQFFEGARGEIEQRHGSVPQLWPSPLDFGRIVRNAFAHGGTIDIRNSNAAPVSWNGLSYGPSDNGKQVPIWDLAAADLIVLMREINGAI